MTKTYKVQHIGQTIGITTITLNNASKEVHWITFNSQSIYQPNITQIFLSSSSHFNWLYPNQISDDTIIQDLLTRTTPNYTANNQQNYNWLEI